MSYNNDFVRGVVWGCSVLGGILLGAALAGFGQFNLNYGDLPTWFAGIGTIATLGLLTYQHVQLLKRQGRLEQEKLHQDKITSIQLQAEKLNEDISSYNTILMKLFQVRQAIATELIQQSSLFNNNDSLRRLKDSVLEVINKSDSSSDNTSDHVLLSKLSELVIEEKEKMANYLSLTTYLESKTEHILTSLDALNCLLFFTKYPMDDEKKTTLLAVTCNASTYLDSSKKLQAYIGSINQLNELIKEGEWNQDVEFKLSNSIAAHISHIICLSRELYQYSDSIEALQIEVLPKMKAKFDYLNGKIRELPDTGINITTDNIVQFPRINEVGSAVALSKKTYIRMNSTKLFISD